VIVSRPFLPDVELFVLAIDSSVDPPVTVAQAVVNPASDGLDYVLDELSTADGELLPPGEYLVVCGSDEDDDGFICGDGDVYCGLYPTLNDPALIRVNGPVAGVDFLVAPLDSDEALTGLPGFPRRAGPSPARSQP
jgi:serine protease